MNNFIFSYLSAVLVLGTLSPNQALAQTVQTYTQTYDPRPVNQATVLDSWMQPAVVRTRTVTEENGDTRNIVEPIIMERHEKVLVPTGETLTTTDTTFGGQVVKTTDHTIVSTKSAVPAYSTSRRHFVAHKYRHHPAVVSTAPASERILARQTVTESTPTVVERRQRIEERAVIIERRDPALNMY